MAGAAAVLLSWRTHPARWWVLLSVVMIVADGLVPMRFFWPRNEIMFVEGDTVHSTEVLRETAREFWTLRWSRLAFDAASAAFGFIGFVAFDRQRIRTQPSRRTVGLHSQTTPHDNSAIAFG